MEDLKLEIQEDLSDEPLTEAEEKSLQQTEAMLDDINAKLMSGNEDMLKVLGLLKNVEQNNTN